MGRQGEGLYPLPAQQEKERVSVLCTLYELVHLTEVLTLWHRMSECSVDPQVLVIHRKEGGKAATLPGAGLQEPDSYSGYTG